MGLFDKLFASKGARSSEKKNSEKIIDVMLELALSLLNDGKAEQAVEQYKSILRMCPNSTAQHNLGSLYAQGRGTGQDFCEGAYYFRQAELNGDVTASKRILKCEIDYIRQDIDGQSYGQLHERMRRFILRVYPEEVTETRVGQELCTMGMHFVNEREYAAGIKLLRAAAEICNEGEAQNALGVLYNSGLGVESNDLISLYWFDRATDNGLEKSKTDRDGLLNAYRNTLSQQEFAEYMELVACWCETGTEDVPRTPDKAEYWRRIAQTAKAGNEVAMSAAQADKMPAIDQERERMVKLCMERMIEMIGQRTRPDGTCPPFYLRFEYPGTSNEGVLHLERSKLEGKPYAFKISAIRSNTDMLISNYMKFGTLNDVIEFLSDRNNLAKMVSAYQHLSESVDDRW